MENVKTLNHKLQLSNFTFFQAQLLKDLIAHQKFTDSVNTIVFDQIDRKLQQYEKKNFDMFKSIQKGGIWMKIKVID